MNTTNVMDTLNGWIQSSELVLSSSSTYIQLLLIVLTYLLALGLAMKIRKLALILLGERTKNMHKLTEIGCRIGSLIYPFLAILMLRILMEVSESGGYDIWLMKWALVIAVLLFYHFVVRAFVVNFFVASLFRWVGLSLLSLHLMGYLSIVIRALEEISLTVGNVEVSVYGLARVIIFGGLLFWLGRASNNLGQNIIRSQKALDIRTREVFSKLYELGLFSIVILLLLNVMGINLTALTVFGGALGVGLGLGLQSIASNFISGIIILLDKSLTVGDFVELDDGKKGIVREFRMRFIVLETFDGKDILVPNEKFISSLLINWTHKDAKQRYRVDFSVPYSTDIRSMVQLIKAAVSEHTQVISGPDVPLEELPDCEIDSFGDSGVNMFVEFWMEGVDDGRNRVGGDLLLTIFETLRENGIEMPFPQREVRILNDASA